MPDTTEKFPCPVKAQAAGYCGYCGGVFFVGDKIRVMGQRAIHAYHSRRGMARGMPFHPPAQGRTATPSGDYMATARDALSAAIRELMSAQTFIDRAGEDALSADVFRAIDTVRVLRCRIWALPWADGTSRGAAMKRSRDDV